MIPQRIPRTGSQKVQAASHQTLALRFLSLGRLKLEIQISRREFAVTSVTLISAPPFPDATARALRPRILNYPAVLLSLAAIRRIVAAPFSHIF